MMVRRPMRSLVVCRAMLLVCVGLVVACRSDDSDSKVVSDLKSVRQVCEARATWTRRIHEGCTKCMAVATVPRCNDCPLHEKAAGRCVQEQRARNAEESCGDVAKCVFRCAKTDCGCVEACYQGKDACQKLDAAVEACTTTVCDADCR